MRITRKKATAALVALAYIGSAVFYAGSASAAEEFDPLALVEAEGLLQGASEDAPLVQAESFRSSEVADTTISPVSVIPLTDAAPVESGDTTTYTSDNYGVVTGTGSNGVEAGFIVLKDESAPRSYSFEIGDEGSSLTLNEDGSVTVLNASGEFVNYIQKPWAVDANNKDLATSYTVEGNVLTQTVNTEGATYPVIADPQTGCGTGWCSIYFNRTETKAIAAGSTAGATAVAAGCAAINVYLGGACAAGFGISAAVAQGAYAAGNCLGWFFTPIGNNPFVEPRGTSHCK